MLINNTFRQDLRTMSLVGLAHGLSHFFHLLLPPLFAAFIHEFGGNFQELGYLVTVFFVVSGVGQALSGFLVDRVGARPVLFAALACFLACAVSAALAQSYWVLLISAALAGLGNAPFHPVDFTILNKRVTPSRLGQAFSIHGVAGNLGWAAAPAFVALMMATTGSWRLTLGSAGFLVLAVGLILFLGRSALDDRAREKPAGMSGPVPAALQGPTYAFLKLPVIWFCFGFFFWTTSALSAIQSFSVPALAALLGQGHGLVAMTVTGFMLCSAVGMLVGGLLVSRMARLEKLIALCLLSSAALWILVGTNVLPAFLSVAVLIISGFGVGLAGPSRDMLIKRAAPVGATGRVYGAVYSGLDLGFALSAPVFGYLLDKGSPQWVFFAAAMALIIAVLSATQVGLRLTKPSSISAHAAA